MVVSSIAPPCLVDRRCGFDPAGSARRKQARRGAYARRSGLRGVVHGGRTACARRADAWGAARSRVRSASRAPQARAARGPALGGSGRRYAKRRCASARVRRLQASASEAWRGPLGRGPRCSSVVRLLGLERLERAQRAPELGDRRAAITQQRLERARAVAVPDQREPEPAVGVAALLEQLVLDAIRHARDATRRPRSRRASTALQRAHERRQFLGQRRLEVGGPGGMLVRQHDDTSARACRASAHSAPSALCLRRSWARAGAVLAARLAGALLTGRPRGRRLHWTWRDSLLVEQKGLAGRSAKAPDGLAPAAILVDHRNIIHSAPARCHADPAVGLPDRAAPRRKADVLRDRATRSFLTLAV